MSSSAPQLVLGALALAYATTVIVTPLTSRLARTLGILDTPDDDPGGHKKHVAPVPYLGGAAVVCGAFAGSSFLWLTQPDELDIARRTFVLGLGIAFVLAAMGLVDDMRPMPRSIRVGAQVLAGLAAWFADLGVQSTNSELVNFLVTMLWIVGITNAFNLLDNMDGLSSGLAGIGALTFAAMAYAEGLAGLAVVAASLGGAAFGFLTHNRPPARIFMGDSGSMFLGFSLAILGLLLRFENLVEVTFLVPVVVLGLPIFDTTLVVLSRLRHRQAVFLGSRDHVSHRLIQVGLTVNTAVGILLFSGLALGWLGLVITRANQTVAYMLLGFVVVVGLFLGWLLWRVPVYSDERVNLAELREEQRQNKITFLDAGK